MKLLRFFSFLLAFTALASWAKAQDITYSAYQKFDSHNGDFSVVGRCGGQLYTFFSSKDGFFLNAWDDSMQRKATIILDFFPPKIYETQFIAYSDHIIVLYQAVEGNKVVQYAAMLDALGRLQGRPLKLDEQKTGFFGPTRTYFASAVSEDKKYIATYAANDKGDDLTMDGTLLNDSLQKVKHIHMAYKGENNVTHNAALLANDGTLYMPVITSVGGKGYADGMWLLALPKDAQAATHTELPLQGHFAGNTYIKMDNMNNRLYVGGFYSDKKSGNYDGVIYAQYGIATNTFDPVKMLPFDDRLRAATGEHKKKHAFNDFQVRQMIIKNDGGFVLLSEEYYMQYVTNYSPFGYYSWYYSPFMNTQSVRTYHYGDVLALSYSGSGNMDWFSFVRKEQDSQEDGGMFSSYSLLNSGGSLGLLYNDFNNSRSRIQLASIDASGTENTQKLDAGNVDDPDWLPHMGKQTAARELVVPCLRKRQLCFVKMVF